MQFTSGAQKRHRAGVKERRGKRSEHLMQKGGTVEIKKGKEPTHVGHISLLATQKIAQNGKKMMQKGKNKYPNCLLPIGAGRGGSDTYWPGPKNAPKRFQKATKSW